MALLKDIGILGGGAWGTAIAMRLAAVGHRVALWAHEAEVVEDINLRHRNEMYLPGVDLPPSLTASNDIRSVASGKYSIIFATPSLFTLFAVKQILAVPNVMEGSTFIGVLTKGFVETKKGHRLILQAMEDYLPGVYKDHLVYISGPSHAEEVAQGKLTGLVAACRTPLNAIRIKHLLNVPPLMVFSSLDVIGVQVAAAVKNVVAIAFGVLDAIKELGRARESFVGDNTESLLLAAGLNEIQILASALGSTHPSATLTSIAGVGDLDVTCRSIHGRNRRFGREIVNKNVLQNFSSIQDLLDRIREVGYLPEGAVAVRYVRDLAMHYRLRMPISMGVYRILNKESDPVEEISSFLHNLAGRYELKDHLDELRK